VDGDDAAGAAGAAADGAHRHDAPDPDLGQREVGEGGAELHERADADADHPDRGAAGEPGEERTVAVRGSVPGAEPDATEADPRRVGVAAGVGGVPGGGLRPGTAAVAGSGSTLPPREARDLGLSRAGAFAEQRKSPAMP